MRDYARLSAVSLIAELLPHARPPTGHDEAGFIMAWCIKRYRRTVETTRTTVLPCLQMAGALGSVASAVQVSVDAPHSMRKF